MPSPPGTQQSPIDLVRADVRADPDVAGFAVHYPTDPVPVEVCLVVVDGDDTPDGPVVVPQVVVTPLESGAHVTLGSDRYDLQSFHWHSPSEHLVDGSELPLELHLVHRSAEGRLLVLGILSAVGERDTAIEPAFQLMAAFDITAPGDGRRACRPARMHLADLIPAVTSTYRYPGSLTTAPFTEGLQWVVCAATRTASHEQIGAHTALVSSRMEGFGSRPQPPGNARRVQDLAGRVVVTDAAV